MSLILDALKKSENERQEQGSAEFSSVPSSPGNVGPNRWLWLLAALLVVNFAVLIGILLRPDRAADPEPTVMPAAEETAVESNDSDSSFEQQIADAIEDLPAAAPTTQATATERTETPAAASPRPQAATRSTGIPTIDQLRLDGSLQLEELHLDIHVYSDVPADRFVFINMDKHREDSRIDAGPVVREITPDGVILEYQGRRFLLPRD
jgi:general secretion pathway protein B